MTTQTPGSSSSTSEGTTTDEPGGSSSGGSTSTAGGSSGGSTSTGVAEGSSDSGSESGQAAGANVSGVVVRTVPPGLGDDGIGNLYMGLLSACEIDAPTVGEGAVVMNADLSDINNEVPFTITGVPDGTHFLVGFLDDDNNTDPDDPDPDMGDLVTADGLGPGCVMVVVVAGVDTMAPAPVQLNFVNPF